MLLFICKSSFQRVILRADKLNTKRYFCFSPPWLIDYPNLSPETPYSQSLFNDHFFCGTSDIYIFYGSLTFFFTGLRHRYPFFPSHICTWNPNKKLGQFLGGSAFAGEQKWLNFNPVKEGKKKRKMFEVITFLGDTFCCYRSRQ